MRTENEMNEMAESPRFSKNLDFHLLGHSHATAHPQASDLLERRKYWIALDRSIFCLLTKEDADLARPKTKLGPCFVMLFDRLRNVVPVHVDVGSLLY
jgi:hypothetical protein